MITYIKLGKVRGLSVELSKNLGSKPIFEKNTFHHETIIDIPYGQLIYTSEKWFPINRKLKRRVSNGNVQEDSKNNQTTKSTG
jgi:hypothetical protein